MDDRDYSYFQRRLDEERTAAQRSSDPAAEVAHLRLAERYEALLSETDGQAGEEQERVVISVPTFPRRRPHGRSL